MVKPDGVLVQHPGTPLVKQAGELRLGRSPRATHSPVYRLLQRTFGQTVQMDLQREVAKNLTLYMIKQLSHRVLVAWDINAGYCLAHGSSSRPCPPDNCFQFASRLRLRSGVRPAGRFSC